MYVIIAPIQIKEGCKEEFVKALLPNAQAAANTEPGCLRFDVIQDAGDPNRLWVYEIYVDEDAFHAHQASEHYLRPSKPWDRCVENPSFRVRPGAAPTSGPPTQSGSREAQLCPRKYLSAMP